MINVVFFAAGLAAGVGLMVYSNVCTRNAVDAERQRGEKRLTSEVHYSDRLLNAAREAERQREDYRERLAHERGYRDGYEAGRHSPAAAAERFAQTFEGRGGEVKFINRTKQG